MTIFVRNLSWNTTEEMLRKVFEVYGEVDSVRIPCVPGQPDRSRGFAFIHMTVESSALVAISAVDNMVVDGRTIHCEKARERQ